MEKDESLMGCAHNEGRAALVLFVAHLGYGKGRGGGEIEHTNDRDTYPLGTAIQLFKGHWFQRTNRSGQRQLWGGDP